jgi:predicted ferric reductase
VTAKPFRGVHPLTSLLRWAVVVLALGVVAGLTIPQAADVVGRALADQHDSIPWYVSRLLAFLAYLAISASVVYGLLLSTGLLDAITHRAVSFTLHQDLASVGLGLAAVHAALLGLDQSIAFGLGDIVVPFAAPYRPAFVALGQVALYLCAIVVGSFYVRRRIGQRAWRILHYVTFVAFALTTAHGILTGTDTAEPWAWWLYVGATSIVAALLAYRIVTALASRARRTSSRAHAI